MIVKPDVTSIVCLFLSLVDVYTVLFLINTPALMNLSASFPEIILLSRLSNVHF